MNQEKYNLSFGGGLLMLGDLQMTAAELQAADKARRCLDDKDREDLERIMAECDKAGNAIRALFSQINGFHTPSNLRLQEIYHKMVAANQPPQLKSAAAGESAGEDKDGDSGDDGKPASAAPPAAVPPAKSPFAAAAAAAKKGESGKPTKKRPN